MADTQAVRTYKMPFCETHLHESLLGERVKPFLPKSPLDGDDDLISYLDSNNKELLDAKIGVRQCHGCKPDENLYLVCYEKGKFGLVKNIRFLANIGGRNGDSHKSHEFLFKTGDYESFSDSICPTCYKAIRKREEFTRYMVTTA